MSIDYSSEAAHESFPTDMDYAVLPDEYGRGGEDLLDFLHRFPDYRSDVCIEDIPDIEEEQGWLLPSYFGLLEVVSKVVQPLSERQRIVLEKRFGLKGCTQETLEMMGQEIGVTRERVRQIEKETLEKMMRKSEPKASLEAYRI